MAKISTTKLFESGQIADEKLREGLGPLIAYINELSDNIIRAVQGKLNFGDNIESQLLSLEFEHGKPKDAVVREPNRVIGVLPLRVLHSSDIITGSRWEITTSGNLRVQFLFKEAIPQKRRVNFLVIYG